MKSLKTKLMQIFAIVMVAFMATSCLDTGKNETPTYYQDIVTIGASEDGAQVWFTGARGRLLANGVPTTMPIKNYVGCRALLYYSDAEKVVPGFDKVVNIAAISIANTNFGVRTASTAEELAAFGEEPMVVEKTDTHLQGEWLDLMASYYGNSEAKNEFSLVAPDPSLYSGVNVPEGYLYLELRQKVSKQFSKVQQNKGMVSFRLQDDYMPESQGYKGIYLRVETGSAAPTYLKIDNVKQ